MSSNHLSTLRLTANWLVPNEARDPSSAVSERTFPALSTTLTPFGFQSERRTFWEAPELYLRVSPFSYANKINEPLLIIHGEADNNSGTFPIQSERLFEALRGNGGTSRYVVLPHEAHGYRARESVLHTLAEMIEWADRWAKKPSMDGAAPLKP